MARKGFTSSQGLCKGYSALVFSFFGTKVVRKIEGKKLMFYDIADTADDVQQAGYDVIFF